VVVVVVVVVGVGVVDVTELIMFGGGCKEESKEGLRGFSFCFSVIGDIMGVLSIGGVV